MKKFTNIGLVITLLCYSGLIGFVIFQLPKIGNCYGETAVCWSRWDSGLYLEIANEGLLIHECGPKDGWPENSGKYCGNCGWAVGYPFLIRLLNPFFASQHITAVVISAAFLFLTMAIAAAYRFSKGDKYYPLYGLLVGTGFGSIYYYAIYPMAICAFLILGIIISWKENKWLISGMLSALLLWFYSIGFMVAGAVFTVLFIESIKNKISWKKRLLPFALPVILSFILWCTMYKITTGYWDALFLSQAKYRHHIQSPLRIAGLRLEVLKFNWGTPKSLVEIQNYLVLLFTLVSIGLAFYKKNRTTLFVAIYSICLYGIPYSMGVDISLYRIVALMIPLVLLIPKNKVWLAFGLLGLFLIFFFPMAKLFFTNQLL